MTRIGDIGTPALITKDIDIGYYVSLARISLFDKVLPEYMYFYIQTPQFQHELWKKTIHVAFPKKINKEDIGECTVKLFSTNKQKEISRILVTIESRILTQKKIINNYESLINGIINDCFSEKGLYKEGTLVSLKDVLLEGNKNPVDTKKYRKITIKLNKEGVVFSNITREMSDTRPFYIREKGELIIGKQNYFNGSVAILSEEYDQTICSNAIMSFKIKDIYNRDFIYHCVSNDLFLKYRSHLANGTGQKELSEKDFLLFNIKLPEKYIQEKVARKINILTQKLNIEKKILFLYEKQKQYLLNKLFI